MLCFLFSGADYDHLASRIAGSAIGAVASDFFPTIVTTSLEIALYAMFIEILVPNLERETKLVPLVVLTAACNCVLAQFMASSWALIVSTLVCAAIGIILLIWTDLRRLAMNASIFILIAGMALETYIPRAISAVLIDKMKLSPRAERLLRLIPYTAMSALIFPGVLWADSAQLENGIVGAAVAGLPAWRRLPIMVCVQAVIAADLVLYFTR